MMFRFRNLILAGVVGTAVGLGCVIRAEDDDNDRKDRDGTVEVDSSRASALVTGRFEGSISGDVFVTVNERQRNVVIAPDRTFVVRDVPTGDVTFAIDIAGLRGSVTIEDVQPSEVIECSVTAANGTITITITRRMRSSEPPREVTQQTGEPLVIQAHNVCYYLRPGIYDRDLIIRGNHVSVLGAASCTAGERSVLNGTLRIEGNNALVQDVELRGSVIVTGNRARIQDSCSRCWADACFAGGGTCGDKCSGGAGTGCETQTSSCPDTNNNTSTGTTDAGTAPVDGGGSTTTDGGTTTTDGGTTTDSGTAEDAGAADGG